MTPSHPAAWRCPTPPRPRAGRRAPGARGRARQGASGQRCSAAAVVVTLPLLLRRRLAAAGARVVAFVAHGDRHPRPGAVGPGRGRPRCQLLGRVREPGPEPAAGRPAVARLMAIGFLAQDADPVLSVMLPFVVLLPSWLLGDVVRTRRLDDLARPDDAATRRSASASACAGGRTEERRRVARELHDVVAHAVSVMLVQAGAARQVVRTSPDQAEEALLAVEATGREAMAELRWLLGVLGDDGEADPASPRSPGWASSTGSWIGFARRVCLQSSRSTGTPRSLPAGLDVTVYRIVQEALTNALRYAREAGTLVRLTFETRQLRIEVLDDGSGRDRRRERRFRARNRRDARAGRPCRRSARGRAEARWWLRGPRLAAPRARDAIRRRAEPRPARDASVGARAS